jgi:hypothetical protein
MTDKEREARTIDALERARKIQENRIRIIACRTVYENGRIVNHYLIDDSSCGRGKCFWI